MFSPDRLRARSWRHHAEAPHAVAASMPWTLFVVSFLIDLATPVLRPLPILRLASIAGRVVLGAGLVGLVVVSVLGARERHAAAAGSRPTVRAAWAHASMGVAAFGLFAASLYLRTLEAPGHPPAIAFLLSTCGLVALGVVSALGGLTSRRIDVEQGAAPAGRQAPASTAVGASDRARRGHDVRAEAGGG